MGKYTKHKNELKEMNRTNNGNGYENLANIHGAIARFFKSINERKTIEIKKEIKTRKENKND